eukprot:UC4_evm4s1211
MTLMLSSGKPSRLARPSHLRRYSFPHMFYRSSSNALTPTSTLHIDLRKQASSIHSSTRYLSSSSGGSGDVQDKDVNLSINTESKETSKERRERHIKERISSPAGMTREEVEELSETYKKANKWIDMARPEAGMGLFHPGTMFLLFLCIALSWYIEKARAQKEEDARLAPRFDPSTQDVPGLEETPYKARDTRRPKWD